MAHLLSVCDERNGKWTFAQYSALHLLFMGVQVEWVYRHSPTETEGMEPLPRILTLRERSLIIYLHVYLSVPAWARAKWLPTT